MDKLEEMKDAWGNIDRKSNIIYNIVSFEEIMAEQIQEVKTLFF